MNSTFWIIITWVRKEDMQLLKSIAELNRDTDIGQNYKYMGLIERITKHNINGKVDLDDIRNEIMRFA